MSSGKDKAEDEEDFEDEEPTIKNDEEIVDGERKIYGKNSDRKKDTKNRSRSTKAEELLIR